MIPMARTNYPKRRRRRSRSRKRSRSRRRRRRSLVLELFWIQTQVCLEVTILIVVGLLDFLDLFCML